MLKALQAIGSQPYSINHLELFLISDSLSIAVAITGSKPKIFLRISKVLFDLWKLGDDVWR